MVHIIENGIVINTILATADEAKLVYPHAVIVDAAKGGAIGWTWDGSTFTAPPAPPEVVHIPDTVTMRQARLALLGAGLLQKVDFTIASMPGVEGDAARITWEFSTEVHRTDALVQSLGPALGFTPEQLNQLFVTAAGL